MLLLHSFNRTIRELKRKALAGVGLLEYSFNRTIRELKRYIVQPRQTV